MSDIQDKKLQNIEGIARQDAIDSPSLFHHGIIDGWRVNENYKTLLLKISYLTNDYAVTMIRATVDKCRSHNKRLEVFIYVSERSGTSHEVNADQYYDDLQTIAHW